MNSIPIIEQIRKNSNLLSLPQVISEIILEAQNEDFSADVLAKSILKDPSMTSRILKMANSSYYHRFAEITTVQQAISLLGVTTVKCLALSSSILHPDRITRDSGVDPREFFSQTLSVASASENIAKVIGYKASEEAFIAGLLHDIGVLVFLHHHPKEYRKIIDKRVSANTLIEAERKIFATDHAEVGFCLAESWGLPSYLAEAIADHHGDPGANKDNKLALIVRLGVALTDDRFSGYKAGIEERLATINFLADLLEMSKSQVEEVSMSMMSSTIDMAEYMGVDIGNIEEMLIKANQEIWKSYLTIENLFKDRRELSQSLLSEERARGALESKNMALATLSHYLNNAVMAIYGHSQIIRLHLDKNQIDKLITSLPSQLEVMDKSVKKIVAVLEEMKDISPVDQNDLHSLSQALNIDDRINQRLDEMSSDMRWSPPAEEHIKI